MKIIPTQSLDLDGIFSELQSSASYSIKGLDINIIVMEHLKKLNLAKSTSKNKMFPRTDKFSVSQSSYDCYRKIYFEMQYPRQADDSKIGTFTMGDIIDSIMKGAFETVGAVTDVGCGKGYFDSKFRIQGSSDIDFSDLIIEVKSVSPFAWKYIVGGKDKLGGVIVGQPKIQHVRQLNTYMDIKNVKDGVLVYVNKDNFQLKPYPVKYSADLMIQTVGRCATVYRSILEKRVPVKVKGDECSYCNHADLCKRYP